jgi:hypothetical protein
MLFPESRLADLMQRANGRLRADAVAAATVRVQAQQEMAMAAINSLIAGLEAQDTSEGETGSIGRDADRLVTLAHAFGLAPLADAARRLCDLVAMLRLRGRRAPDALAVHIQALRLFAPDSPIIGDDEAALVLGRIAALAAHLSAR